MSLDDKITRRTFLKATTYGIAAASLSSLFPEEILAETKRKPLYEYANAPLHPVFGIPVDCGNLAEAKCIVYLECKEGKPYQNCMPHTNLTVVYKDDNNVSIEDEGMPSHIAKAFGYGGPLNEATWQQLCWGSVKLNTGAGMKMNELWTEGNNLYNRKVYHYAKKRFEELVIRQPEQSLYWEKLAACYFYIKRKDAVRILKAGIKFNPDAEGLRHRLIMYE